MDGHRHSDHRHSDDRLGETLRASAPSTRVPLGLADHRRRILAEARNGGLSRGRRWLLGGAIAAIVLAGGGAAAAGSNLVTPWGWTADNAFTRADDDGGACYAGIRIVPEGVAEDSEIMVAARALAADIDPYTLDTSAAEHRILADNAAATGTDQRDIGPSQLRKEAVFQTIADIVFDGLEQQGFPSDPTPVSVAFREGCGAGE